MSARASSGFPREVIRPASWADVAMSVFGALLLLAAFNAGGIWLLAHRSPNLGYRLVSEKWEILLGLKQPVDWLIVGDSVCNQGVVPGLMNDQLHIRSLNLCTAGNLLAVGDVWMLETYLKKPLHPPRAVLVVHSYDIWARESDAMIPMMIRVPLAWGFWTRFGRPLNLHPGDQIKLLLARHVPIYADNRSLSRVLRAPWELLAGRPEIQKDGYMPWPGARPEDVERDARGHLAALKERPRFMLSAINQEALADLRRLAEASGFDVYLANGPIYEGLYREPAFQSYFEQVQRSLRAFAATSPRIRYINQMPLTFSKDEMQNVDHLIDAASRKYTQHLIDEIRAYRHTKRIAQSTVQYTHPASGVAPRE